MNFYNLTNEEKINLCIDLINKAPDNVLDDVIEYIDKIKNRCIYIKREGESCSLNNKCTYPNCKKNE